MPITEDRIEKLREFGLSEYAARAYLALLDLGLSEARDISTLSRVPTSKIYHILEQLHEKGLVEILPEYPKKYAPIPFEEYVDKLRAQHEEVARALRRERDNLAELFSVSGETDMGDRGGFTVVRGRRNVLAKAHELINEADETYLYMGSRGSYQRVETYHDEVRRAKERGVQLRFLLPHVDDASERYAPFLKAGEVRVRTFDGEQASDSVALVVTDDASAFLINFIPDDGHVYQGNDVGIYTDQEALVAAFRDLVEPKWQKAKRM